MPIQDTIRLIIHPMSDTTRMTWALLRYRYDVQGVPHVTLQEHGVLDLTDPDLVGIEAVARMLARAAAPTT